MTLPLLNKNGNPANLGAPVSQMWMEGEPDNVLLPRETGSPKVSNTQQTREMTRDPPGRFKEGLAELTLAERFKHP